MKKLMALAMAGACVAGQCFADVKEEEIAHLREQVRILSERLDQLEQSSSEVAAKQQQSEADIEDVVDIRLDERLAESWTSRISWKGDFRYRYENIEVEGLEPRSRERIRARAHLEARLADQMKVGLGIASGGDDPVSTNQTLGGGGSTKDINLNLAYFEWSGLRNTEVVGGKFKNFLYRPGGNGLIWDSDWNPEGLAADWNNGQFFASGLGTWVESDTGTLNDKFAFGVQAGGNFALTDELDLTVGAGYYQFDSAGSGSFFGDDDDFFGNSFDPVTMTYLYNYHELEAFANLGFQMFERPASVFVDYVTNLDVEENDAGYAFGVSAGSLDSPGSWEFSVIYEDLQADAVLGLLTDSDFGGGGTNARGYILNGAYAFHKSWNAMFTYFINDINIDSHNPRGFDRLQLDLNFKYK